VFSDTDSFLYGRGLPQTTDKSLDFKGGEFVGWVVADNGLYQQWKKKGGFKSWAEEIQKATASPDTIILDSVFQASAPGPKKTTASSDSNLYITDNFVRAYSKAQGAGSEGQTSLYVCAFYAKKSDDWRNALFKVRRTPHDALAKYSQSSSPGGGLRVEFSKEPSGAKPEEAASKMTIPMGLLHHFRVRCFPVSSDFAKSIPEQYHQFMRGLQNPHPNAQFFDYKNEDLITAWHITDPDNLRDPNHAKALGL